MNEIISDKITVLRNILNDEVFSAFLKYAEKGESFFAEFVYKLLNSCGETNFLQFVQNLILCDENAFSIRCAKGLTPSPYLLNAYSNDLKIIFNAVTKAKTHGYYNNGNCSDPFNESFNHTKTVNNLISFYKTRGYGKFIGNIAFTYENGELVPVENPSKITLVQLKDYGYEKKIIKNNIESFIKGLPFSDMLLYGDMGTGKSSTVHAMLNEFAQSGLRLIELNKENMLQIPKIKQHIISNPLKFIIFIDDLSLDEHDEKLSSFKASLEGSLSSGASNVMIVATSNRRHIVKESFSDRENSVHATDSIQEQLSLSDRFGLTVMFSSTGKSEYLSIVKQLADDSGLKIEQSELYSIAERWAIEKGGRSPRRAKQIVELIYSCTVKGEKIEF